MPVEHRADRFPMNLTLTCPDCGTENVFPEFKPGDDLTCSGCGKAPKVVPCAEIFSVGDPISAAEFLRRQIAVRTEGHTIIATVPTDRGGTKELRMDKSGTVGTVSVEFHRVDNQTFEYTYYFGNDATAYGNAIWARLGVEPNQFTHERAPDGWIAMRGLSCWGQFRGPGIAPGEQAGPFTLRSALAPGITSLVVGGRVVNPQLAVEGCPPSDLMDALYGYGGAFDEPSIQSVLLTIGPRFASLSLEALQGDIGWAATRPEFAAIADDLMSIRDLDPISMRAGLASLRAGSSLQEQFVRSIVMNLEALKITVGLGDS